MTWIVGFILGALLLGAMSAPPADAPAAPPPTTPCLTAEQRASTEGVKGRILAVPVGPDAIGRDC